MWLVSLIEDNLGLGLSWLIAPYREEIRGGLGARQKLNEHNMTPNFVVVVAVGQQVWLGRTLMSEVVQVLNSLR